HSATGHDLVRPEGPVIKPFCFPQAGRLSTRGRTMATAEQLKALIDSFQQGDNTRFKTIALQIAARSAKQGKSKLAEELRALVERPPQQHSGRAIPLARPPKDLAGLLEASYPTTRIGEMVLTDA